MTDNSSVKVAIRIRPQIPKDIIDLCHVCTTVASQEPQIWLGKDKAFTFDDVFDMHNTQEDIYEKCVKHLVEGCFEGYNATVLAYGQTGSGKTYTMGTGFDLNYQHVERGIIPRAVEHLFDMIAAKQKEAKETGLSPPVFQVNAQFMELYNEEIIDLLDTSRVTDNKNKKTQIKIHEDADGGIYTIGVIVQCITSVEEALQCLKLGSLSRTTASTGMNAQSSRSHAIFTLYIKQQRVGTIMPFDKNSCNSVQHEHSQNLKECEILTAKFHFVDLAGSERLKRTQATGDRQREGISINSGLLALGNVISALGDKSRKSTHIPYRDSKLTRLLQDSLGGNSRTLMIACISPSDRDFMETLNTLKYANRAKNIKNRVTVNLDKTSQTIHLLRKEVESLRLELMEYKQGKRIIGEDGVECVNDMYYENSMLQAECNTLKTRIKALQDTIDRLTIKNTELLTEKAAGNWIVADGSGADIAQVLQEYIKEIETLRAKLMESEEVCSYLRKHFNKSSSRLSSSPTSTVAITGHYDIRVDTAPSVYELLEEAKEDVRKLKRKKKKLKEASQEKENSEIISEEEKDTTEQNEKHEEDDEEDEDEGDEDTTSESEHEYDYSEDLAGLTCEISLKEKLIHQLEMSQRRLQNMRQHYEEKLIQLQNQIRETENERNRVLTNLSRGSEIHSEDKIRRVREDYEQKISTLKGEVKTMQAARKEHTQFMKNRADYEQQLKKLKQELADMKKAKVTLVNKMKEEAKKHKESEQKRNREIAQLRKERRSKETQIKTLEAEKKLKEAILRRKQEEVIALRKRSKTNLSRKTSSQMRTSLYSSRYASFSPKIAKQKWQNLEKKITKLVANKQSIATIEKDMERWLHEREKLSRCLEKVLRKRDRAHMEMKGEDVIDDLDEEIENLKANIDYIHENLTECQTSIVQMEEAKDDMDALDVTNMLKNMHLEETKYLIEKLLNMAINQSFQAAQREVMVKELESKLKQVIESNAVQEQLLLHVVHQANENILGMIESSTVIENTDHKSADSSRSASPVDNMPGVTKQQTFVMDTRKKKARKVAVTPEDLLFSNGMQPGISTETFCVEEYDPLLHFPSKPNEAVIKARIEEHTDNGSGDFSSSGRGASFQTGKHGDFEVLSRSSLFPEEFIIPKGNIYLYNEARQQSNSLLVCTHVAEGHTQAVLCIECTDDVLFSSSADKTVKIWDLNSGKELQQFVHPCSVTKVRYCEYTRLAFTASMSYIKVWDVREKPSNCIQTLCSSGISKKGSMASETFSKYNVLPPGESHINDIALNHYGTTLFSASSGSIRMWDLRMFQSVGALNAGFQSRILCLAVDEISVDNNLVVSGSEDHAIKVFEVMEESRGVHAPKFTLKPPHYDCIEALSISGDFLFSASRDMCIKKWDLRKRCLEKSVQQAHNDWVFALNVIPSGSLVLSGCRSGHLNVWSANNFEKLEEIKAHSAAISSLASNNTCIFTASHDCNIGIWSFGSSSPIVSLDQEF